MKEFQKLYHRVVDYTPPEELSIKISLLLREIELKNAESAARELGARGKFSPLRFDAIHNLFRKDPEAEKKQLVKVITDEEELANFASPQGILIHGEVGCVIKEEDSDNHESNWLKLIKIKALGLLEDSEIVKNDDIKMDDPKLQDKVPVLTTKMKNEARRFITLLDAIYEAKCQFFMRSDVPIDNLFFPDAVATKRDIDEAGENRLQVQDEEMFAKTAIAMSNPYRPNIASYDQEHTETYDEFTNSIKKAFVGDKTQNEDHDRETDNRKIDFKNIKAFTGEDEKFAYKRAILRIREMVGSEIWRSTNRWVPIDQSMRPWEYVGGSDELYWGKRSINGQYIEEEVRQANEKMDELLKQKNSVTKSLQNDLPRNVSANHGIAFRQFNARIAPVFKNVQHFFGLNGWTTKWLRSKTRNDN
ncbi:hypothetical protein QCA50_012069 [Cerrena zonata]|uniref:Uncharacterized protein n=1 Tax=Cerrena zonata TaxID=2478898 RepID=A0AAW0G546_9APHY